jgi:hypothetical protein
VACRHYTDPNRERRASPLSRFSSGFDVSENGCWFWVKALDRDGYAKFRGPGGITRAHRFSFEYFVGPIPDGLTIDHLCRVRRCVYPGHLEAVPMGVNNQRGISPSALNARKEQCLRGHPFDESNTYRFPDGRRGCRACMKMHRRLHRLKKAAA